MTKIAIFFKKKPCNGAFALLPACADGFEDLFNNI